MKKFIYILLLLGVLAGGFYLYERKTQVIIYRNTSTGAINQVDTYTKGVKKIDYSLTMTGLQLDAYTGLKSVFMSGSALYLNGKTFTGEYMSFFNQELTQKGEKYFVKKNLGNIDNPLGNTAQSGSIDIEIIFLDGLTKMKLLGSEYKYIPNNLSLGKHFDFNLFLISKNKGYVLMFENADESKKRKEQFDEYTEKLSEIKLKYSDDLKKKSQLIFELNNAYNIDVSKLK